MYLLCTQSHQAPQFELHNSNSTSLCLLIGLDAFLWSWSAADETGKLRTYRGAVLTVRVGGWLYDSLTQMITFFGYKFYKNMEVFWTKYGSRVLSAGLSFQRTSSNEKDSCKGKDRPLNHSSIFFLDTHLLQVSNISSVQPPPASGANPPEPHLVGGQSHKSVVRFRHFASLPLLHLHGVLPPDKLYKNSPNSDKTRPLAAKLCPSPTWWALPSVGDFIHQIYLQVISTSFSCRGG